MTDPFPNNHIPAISAAEGSSQDGSDLIQRQHDSGIEHNPVSHPNGDPKLHGSWPIPLKIKRCVYLTIS